MVAQKINFKARVRKTAAHLRIWLTPGLGIKRWVVILLIGITFIALGFTVVVLDLYRGTEISWLRSLFNLISLSKLPRWTRALIFGILGLTFLSIGLYQLNKSILRPFVKPGQHFLDTFSSYQRKARGPKIVAIGGGTGLASLLRGLKNYTHNLTAIVTVADDGGSSGILRKNLGILPPGDIRNCLTALADDEEMLSHVFQYRFGKRSGVNGHSLGNLFISALTDITGSFEDAVAESGRVLAVRGRVLPSTLHDVKLVAEIQAPGSESEEKVVGESMISQLEGSINHIWLEPSNPLAFPPAVQAILNADLLIIGPGSLFTSVLPNLLVPGLSDAIRVSESVKFLVCNVANQQGETVGFHCGDHVRTIEKHLNAVHFDVIICNNEFIKSASTKFELVLPEPGIEEQYSFYFAPLVDEVNPWRHDSKKLAQVITDLFNERTGPLGETGVSSRK
jgi:uncharacterized cofD-like protein